MGESLGSGLLPETKSGKASGVFGIVAAILALMAVFEGRDLTLKPSLYMIFIPIWLFALSSFFMSFEKSESKNYARLSGLIAFIASLVGFLATFLSFATVTILEDLQIMSVMFLDIEFLLIGATLVLGSILLFKVGMKSTEKPALIIITAIVYLAIGIFGFYAVALAYEIPLYAFTIYPLVAGTVIVPSIFTIAI